MKITRILRCAACLLLIVEVSGCAAKQRAPLTEPVINSHGRSWYSEKALFLDEDVFFDTLKHRISADYYGRLDAMPLRDAETLAKAAADIVELLSFELPPEDDGKPATLLYTLGALAGFSSQMAARETMRDPLAGMTGSTMFEQRSGVDDRTYFFSNIIDLPLYDTRPGHVSVIPMILSAAQAMGASNLPNIKEIRGYYKDTAGTRAYRLPRVSAPIMPRYDIFEATDMYWNVSRNYLLSQHIPPLQWPKTFGAAIADVIGARSTKLDPELSAVLATEGVVAGAHIDPEKVRHARLGIERGAR